MVGLALDSAKIYLVAHQLQNAADAAALAGARLVKADPSAARMKAYEYAYANYYADADSVILDENWSNAEDGDIVIGKYFHQYGTFVPVEEGEFANAVKVVARCTGASPNPPVSLNFGPIADVHTANVSRYAIAVSSGGTGAGLITLGCGDPENPDPNSQTGTGLDIEGGSVIDVSGGVVEGEIQVNCASCDHPKPAVSGGGAKADIEGAQINVVGCYGGPEVDVPIAEGADYMPDPLGCYPNYDCLMPPPPYDESYRRVIIRVEST
jgi:hypothetical protein